MDFFKTLPDEAIESILLYCHGREVLRMMEASKRIKDLVVNNSKLMGKIRLMLHLCEAMDVDGLIQLVESHKFSALRLVFNSSETIIEKLPSNYDLVLELLSKSVVDIVVSMDSSIEDFETLMRKFLPKIEECRIDGSTCTRESFLDEETTEAFFESPSRIQSSSLKVLKVYDNGILFLKCFAACNSVHTFEMIYTEHDQNISCLNAFLSRQHKLKTFLAVYRDFSFFENNEMPTIHSSWANMEFRLEKFEVIGANLTDEIAAMNFFKAQQELKVVTLSASHIDLPELVSSIITLPKLEKFQADGCGCSICETKIECFLHNHPLLVKLSAFPDESLAILHMDPSTESMIFMYCPRIIDISARFEENVLNFIRTNSNHIQRIKIGNKLWGNQEFELSLEFCKTLVQVCPGLLVLNLYNVKSPKEFTEFLFDCHLKPRMVCLNSQSANVSIQFS